MKKLYNCLLVVLAIAFASCSDVAENERFEHVAQVPVGRNVLIEDFTGQRCANCPTATEAIEALQETYGADTVIAVGIHSGPLGFKGNSSSLGLMTDLGNTYYYHWNASYQPVGLVNRHGLCDYPTWSANVRQELAKQAPVSLQLSNAYHAEDNSVDITLNATGKEGGVAGNIQVWLVEDSITAIQVMPDGQFNKNYVHNHVYRGAVNGDWGEPFSLYEGEVQTLTWHYALSSSWVPSHVSVVAFVYNDDGVQQVTKASLLPKTEE